MICALFVSSIDTAQGIQSCFFTVVVSLSCRPILEEQLSTGQSNPFPSALLSITKRVYQYVTKFGRTT